MNSNKISVISLGTLGSVKVTELETEDPKIYAKLPSTSPSPCPSGGVGGMGGANLDDDGGCPSPPGPIMS